MGEIGSGPRGLCFPYIPYKAYIPYKIYSAYKTYKTCSLLMCGNCHSIP